MAQHLTFQLTQHTPIIHFQGDQAGATLRATELKPKLDKFLLEKLNEKGSKVPKEWKRSDTNQALDYKVRIIIDADYVSREVIHKANNPAPMYFGDTGKNKEKGEKLVPDKKMYLSYSEEPLSVSFISFHSELLEKISDFFPEFIFKTNFGTRQSKGYGSFTCLNSQPKDFNYPHLEIKQVIDIEKTEKDGKKHKIEKLPRAVKRDDFIKILKIVNYYYQRLKSGINRTGHYKKSFLATYLFQNSKMGYSWEKAWLKEKFLNAPKKENVPKFSRAILGLNPRYRFIPKDKVKNPRRNEVYPLGDDFLEIDVEHITKEISRFQSPISFKPVFASNIWRVYILVRSSYDEILDKEFSFSDTKSGKSFTLSTPNRDNAIDLKLLIAQYHKDLHKDLPENSDSEFYAFEFFDKLAKVKTVDA